MGISKLVKTIRNNEIAVETFPVNGKYEFFLLNEDKEHSKILVSCSRYNSSKEAEKQGNEFVWSIKNYDFKDVSYPK